MELAVMHIVCVLHGMCTEGISNKSTNGDIF